MADVQWKKGDVVMLNSGGPKMTISNVGTVHGTPTIWCVWFDGTKKIEDTFAPESLREPPKAAPRVSMI